jgi:uncharacterized protein with von Willebrand factor type A (vWA) domain
VDATPTAVGLARTLRAAGVAAGPRRVQEFLSALDVLDATQRNDVYWAGRLTLCATPDDLERYDRVFAAYWTGESPHRRLRAVPPLRRQLAPAAGDRGCGRDQDVDEQTPVVALMASDTEVLRHRDFSSMTPAERAELHQLLAAFRMSGELRRTRRARPAARGRLDRERTVRAMLRRGGEPARLRRETRRQRPRRLVLLVDVSGSMSAYAGGLLRFVHAAARSGDLRGETFTIGTRLTRVTRELRHRDPDTALAELSASVPDWSGGTRLGELLKAFLDGWGQRGMARGAVVVILSDGWERGDVGLLAEQMARLSRLAHRVVWANPLKVRPGYAPLAAGMAAALPYVDDFVEGHSLAALERLAAIVAGAHSWAGSDNAHA